jgi:hypothetical protein
MFPEHKENDMGTEQMLKVKGCYHLQIEDEKGNIVGDSGPVGNIVVTEGFRNITRLIANTGTAGTQWSHVNVGTGAAPASNATALPGEVSGTNNTNQRASVTAATSGTSKTLRFTATMASANSFVTTDESISNVGVFFHSDLASLAAGAAYASSTVGTNQAVNITYDVIFETA